MMSLSVCVVYCNIPDSGESSSTSVCSLQVNSDGKPNKIYRYFHGDDGKDNFFFASHLLFIPGVLSHIHISPFTVPDGPCFHDFLVDANAGMMGMVIPSLGTICFPRLAGRKAHNITSQTKDIKA